MHRALVGLLMFYQHELQLKEGKGKVERYMFQIRRNPNFEKIKCKKAETKTQEEVRIKEVTEEIFPCKLKHRQGRNVTNYHFLDYFNFHQ